jgi:protein subunit release factor B
MRKLLFSVRLKDCRVDTFRGSGPGGQHRNKVETAVRVTHEPSGAVGQCSEEKSQLLNKRRAFRRMAESREFQLWAKTLNLKPIEDVVEDQMDPKNLRVEGRRDGRWTLGI